MLHIVTLRDSSKREIILTMNNTHINTVTDGILKNSPVTIDSESRIYIYDHRPNEHLEICEANRRSVKIVKNSDDVVVLDIFWITDERSEITVDRKLCDCIKANKGSF